MPAQVEGREFDVADGEFFGCWVEGRLEDGDSVILCVSVSLCMDSTIWTAFALGRVEVADITIRTYLQHVQQGRLSRIIKA
jgi:hypothetical protein